MDRTKLKNTVTVVILTVCLGAVVGFVIWCFLLISSKGGAFIWSFLPEKTGVFWLNVPLCAAAGLAVGLIRRRCGDYPEDLAVVMGKVKREKHYGYDHMAAMLACALIPLIFGASVGPEAGLTGIIAALCYWIGDNVKYAKQNAAVYSELGEAVTLGQIFHSPLFGILAVEEEPLKDGKLPEIPKVYKLVLYGLSGAVSFFVIALLNRAAQTSSEGFPRFSEVTIQVSDYVSLLLYIPVGILLFIIFEAAEKAAKAGASRVPPVLRETICGAVIGVMGIFAPMVLFSGEEQMAELIGGPGSFVPWILIGISLLKLVMTAFCVRFGMKGGHFFPLIFACTCMGIGLSGLLFPGAAEHAVFAAGVVTAATLGAQLKKPLAVTVLMLLCFPVRMLLWLFVAAAIGGRIAQMFSGKPEKKAPQNAKKLPDGPSSGI
ncbi:MAG: chloride channel protein [Clostridia bacterium]|nr:chloride channel protein [Clostridia bacterium]